MLEIRELGVTILRFRTQARKRVVVGLTFIGLVLVPEQERVVLDRLVVSEEGVRQLALAA